MRPEPAPNGAADLGQPQQESLPALRGKPLGQPFLYLRQPQGDHKGGQDPGANGQGAAGDGSQEARHGGGQGPDRIVREIHSAFKECGQAVLGHGLQILRQLANGSGVVYTYTKGQLSELSRRTGSTTQNYSFVYSSFGRMTELKVGSRTLAKYEYAIGNGNLTK